MLTPTDLDPPKGVQHFAIIFAISVCFMENESGFPNFFYNDHFSITIKV